MKIAGQGSFCISSGCKLENEAAYFEGSRRLTGLCISRGTSRRTRCSGLLVLQFPKANLGDFTCKRRI